MTIRLQQLDYPDDPARLFEPVSAEPWAVWLDSGGAGRYDIIASRPSSTLVTRGDSTWITSPAGEHRSSECPFQLLRHMLNSSKPPDSANIPFMGGAIGYFGYDLARRMERLPEQPSTPDRFADMAFGIYDWALAIDHQERKAWLVALQERISDSHWCELVQRFRHGNQVRAPMPPLRALKRPEGVPDKAHYARAFAAIQRYIHEGDCYQINFARRFQTGVKGNPWPFYRQMRQRSPAPYGGYFNLPWGQLLCNSPEAFLQLCRNEVTTSPIKGTRPRAEPAELDSANLRALIASEKDRAENLMIVDLLRNDLGRSCAYGSIRVDQLFRPASFANVHHLISDISARLRPDEDAISLLQKCFPGGSITGAPKVRAMEIISELETARRGPYCGSLAWIGFDGRMGSNILIRTLLHAEGTAWFWSGGGIVADSDLDQEFAETCHKASVIMDLLMGEA
jgi:para-aminobenzoate synthetase component 1